MLLISGNRDIDGILEGRQIELGAPAGAPLLPRSKSCAALAECTNWIYKGRAAEVARLLRSANGWKFRPRVALWDHAAPNPP